MDSRDWLILAGVGGLAFFLWRRSKAQPQSAAAAPTTVDAGMTASGAANTQFGQSMLKGLITSPSGLADSGLGVTPLSLRAGQVYKTWLTKDLIADTAPPPQSPTPNTYYKTTTGVSQPLGVAPPPTLGTNPTRGVFG